MISIIIPVYHCETYLKDALDSVLNQTFSDYEILLIDSNPENEKSQIAKKYTNKYSNVYLFENDILGAGTPRNIGVQHAKGEYLLFMDADDFLPTNDILEAYVKEMDTKNCDILVGNYMRLWDGKYLQAKSHALFSKYTRNDENFVFKGFFSVGTLSYVWAKLYRKEFIVKNHIHFKSLMYAEDKLFNIECYFHNPKYNFIDKNVYVYRKNDDSISYQYRPNPFRDWFSICNVITSYNKDSSFIDYILFFAAFFDSKMEYEEHHCSLKAIKNMLKIYGTNPYGKKSFKKLSTFQHLKSLDDSMWKMMMFCFSLAMHFKFYSLISFGLKFLVDCKTDERLSDTGKRK